MKKWVLVIGLIAILATGCLQRPTASGLPQPQEATLEEPFDLAPQQTAVIKNDGLSVTFDNLTGGPQCTDKTVELCIGNNLFNVMLSVRQGNQTRQVTLGMSPDRSPKNLYATVFDHTITLVGMRGTQRITLEVSKPK